MSRFRTRAAELDRLLADRFRLPGVPRRVFVSRILSLQISLVLLLAGLVWTFWGFARLRTLAFPFLLLATMVPLP